MESSVEIDKEKLKKYNYAILVGVATFIGVVVMLIILTRMYDKSQKITAEANEKSAFLHQLQEKKEILDNLKSREEELKKSAATLATALPEDKDIGRLFIQLNGLIGDTGGSIKGITAGASQGEPLSVGGTLNKYSFGLPISFRDYESVKSFFTETRQSLRLMDIESLNLTAADGGAMDTSLTINTYSRN